MLKQKTSKLRNTCIKIGICLLLTACTGSGGDNKEGTQRPCAIFDCKGMLSNLGKNIMLPAIQKFNTDASAMKTAVDDYRVSLVTSDEDLPKRDVARAAWKSAMASWQAVEMMQIGPLKEGLKVKRNRIYSWPETNSCGVDEDVVFAEDVTYDLKTRPRGRIGMDALEYVLFSDDLNHSCVKSDPVPNWNGRSPADRRSARAKYANLVATDVATRAASLESDWKGFLVDLARAGSEGGRFSSVEEAVNSVSDALFYFEDDVKDIKLAKALGLKINTCSPTIPNNQGCPAEVESPFSQTSKQNIVNNLKALQKLFLGNEPGAATEGLGFDDFLDKLGGDSGLLRNAIADAMPKIDAIPVALGVAVSNSTDYVIVKDAHIAAKVVTDQLKDNFLRILGLNIPGATGGDGD